MRPENLNFILGAGEQFVETVQPPPRAPQVRAPYTPEEARNRLAPRLSAVVQSITTIRQDAMPDGEAVAKLVLHPQFQSKSAFPSDLLRDAGLRAIGSKPSLVTPEKVARRSEPREEATSTLFVAGNIDAFQRFSAKINNPGVRLADRVAEELTAVEDFQAMVPTDRVSDFNSDDIIGDTLECILHAQQNNHDRRVISAFVRYAASLGLTVDQESELFASGLCFMAVQGDLRQVNELAFFSYLRRIRPMPRIKPFLPSRIMRAGTGLPVQIPDQEPLDPGLTAAVFDTALPDDHALGHWVTPFDYGLPVFEEEDESLHGLCVASAATLGPLDNLTGGRSPYHVHHHGVLGDEDNSKSYLTILKNVQEQVLGNDYPLFNLSFGPLRAVVDGDVDAFTAVVDDLLADGRRLGFIAVGNEGHLNDDIGLNRIQPPSDAVNGIGVGSADSRQANWARAQYSCVGPGRFGCRVKPDLVTFGGSMNEPFGVIGQGAVPDRANTQGTSFASPNAMRTAGEVMAAMGTQITPMGVRALLIHNCRPGDRERKQVGHGLLPTDLTRLLTCSPNEASIIFQGELAAGRYTQHTIPMPLELDGNLEIEATLTFATPVDSNFPSTYVQAGIEALFRPHSGRHNSIVENGVRRQTNTIKTEPLFNQRSVYGASDTRRDAHLWDTALKTKKTKRFVSLQNPTIELHYNLRQDGQPVGGSNQPTIRYALVLTLRSRTDMQLYNKIRARYGNNLQLLVPRANVMVRL